MDCGTKGWLYLKYPGWCWSHHWRPISSCQRRLCYFCKWSFPPNSVNALTPHQGRSRPLERCLPPSPLTPIPTTPPPSPVPNWNKANLTFLSTNLACYWLLSGEQLDPQTFFSNILTNSFHHKGLQKGFLFLIIFLLKYNWFTILG